MVAPAKQITVTLHTQSGAEAAPRSITSVCDALRALGEIGETIADRFPDLFHRSVGDAGVEFVIDLCKLLRVEVIDRAAGRANEIRIGINPDDRYLELVAAVADELRGSRDVCLHHGWPILSVVDRTTTVAGRGEAASLSPDGANRNGSGVC